MHFPQVAKYRRPYPRAGQSKSVSSSLSYRANTKNVILLFVLFILLLLLLLAGKGGTVLYHMRMCCVRAVARRWSCSKKISAVPLFSAFGRISISFFLPRCRKVRPFTLKKTLNKGTSDALIFL